MFLFKDTKFSLCPCYEKIWWIEASEIKFSEDKESIEFKRCQTYSK